MHGYVNDGSPASKRRKACDQSRQLPPRRPTRCCNWCPTSCASRRSDSAELLCASTARIADMDQQIQLLVDSATPLLCDLSLAQSDMTAGTVAAAIMSKSGRVF